MNLILAFIFVIITSSCNIDDGITKKMRDKFKVQYLDTTTFYPYSIIVAANNKNKLKYFISQISDHKNIIIEDYQRIVEGKHYNFSYYPISSDTLKLDQILVRRDIAVSYNNNLFFYNDSVYVDLFKSDCIKGIYIRKHCN